MNLTKKKYIAGPSLDYRDAPDGETIYFIKLRCRIPRWIVEPGYKFSDKVVPKGTLYYNNFNDAMLAFNGGIHSQGVA